MFLFFRKACLLHKTSKIVSSRFSFTIYDMGIHGGTRGYRGLHRVTTGLTKPWKKCQFYGFFKPMFSLFKKACLLYKMSKIVFSRFIFTIFDIGIQAVKTGYRRLQWVTRGYRGLQGVTRGDRG